MGVSGIPEGGDQVVKKNKVNPEEVKQKRADAIQQGFTKGMQDYFKHTERKELINEKKALTEQMLEVNKKYEELKKQLEAEKNELKALEELRAKDMEADLATKWLETQEKLAKAELQQQELSPKEKAKAELRKFESEYNKNFEKMTEEEIIQMEIQMGALKQQIVGKQSSPEEDIAYYQDLLATYNVQKEEILKELDNESDEERKLVLLQKYQSVNDRATQVQAEIDAIKEKELNEDSNFVGIDAKMLANYKTQKEEILKELKTVGTDYERKTALETRLQYVEIQISELQEKIDKNIKLGLKSDNVE